MADIDVTHEPTADDLDRLGVTSWPIWSCEVSQFPWTYDAEETCYLLEGEVIATPDGADPVTIKAGDLVVFPAGMSCH